MKGETSPYKTLSIRISTNGFCFCTYTASNPDTVQIHFYKTDNDITLYANLCKAIDSCPLALDDVSEVKAIIATCDFTTIPAEYDNRNQYKIFYRSCFPKAETNIEIIANRLTAQNITVLFPVDRNIYDRLSRMGNVTYYTPASIILGYIAHRPFDCEKYMLAYYMDEGSLIVSMNSGKVELINSFVTPDNRNQIYYLLAIWKAQGLSQTADRLYLCGNKRVEELSNFISQFIRNRERINPSELFTPNLLNKISATPFDIQALLLCE